MKNLAPKIWRQRLLIEGFYNIEVNKKVIGNYFNNLTSVLKMKMYGKPIIFSPGGIGKKENQGYDAFAPLIDSGISLYIWTNSKFLSAVIYSCRSFDEKTAIKMTKNFFKIYDAESKSF